ncbi:uncharacterized protein LOC114533647 [Dendronephthya gigantea]|uniref:uncharacterized protein LOC114533647 n=1 Tax=Dendronephthya gigantea TaxID=151771 RepID=UPI00106A3BEA|nr:uncharacterized protein LOC114533647 [Dendronephthya gigantea]
MFTNYTNVSETTPCSVKWAWKTHWISFSILFIITGCFSTALLFKAVYQASMLTRGYRLSVFIMVLILCVSRPLYLLLNPYEIHQALLDETPVIILRILYSFGQPSLTAGFGLVHACFLKVAKARNYEYEPLLKTRTILMIVGLYFTFGIICEVISLFLPVMTRMLVVSATIAVVGCIIIIVTVSYSGLRILIKATKNKRVLSKSLRGDTHAASREELMKAKSISKVSKVTLAASTFCIAITIINSITFVKMFNAMSGVSYLESDSQFITFVTCVRFLEICMAVTLLYALSQTNLKSRNVSGSSRQRLGIINTGRVRSADDGYVVTDTWKSISSVSSVGSGRQLME